MAITKLSASGVVNFVKYRSMLAGNLPYEPPAPSAYDLLETEILTGSPADIQFSSLGAYSSIYQHLQIRFVIRGSRTGNSADSLYMRMGTGGSVDSGSNYAWHYLRGNGSTVSSSAASSQSQMMLNLNAAAANYTANAYTAGVIDLLDPFETTKFSTVRCLTGQTTNENSIYLSSGLWQNTGSVTDILFTHQISPPAVGSRYSLYGLKAA